MNYPGYSRQGRHAAPRDSRRSRNYQQIFENAMAAFHQPNSALAQNPRSPLDPYTSGLASLNRGAFNQAGPFRRQALQENAQSGHMHYAIAVCAGNPGDSEAAPRDDTDFQKLARIPKIRGALGL